MRAVVSFWSWGQSGPVTSVDTRVTEPRRSRKYGAPESYGQALVVGKGASPCTSTSFSVNSDTATSPVCRRSGRWLRSASASTDPQPVRRNTSPTRGARSARRIGVTRLTGASNRINATSAVGLCRTSTTCRVYPPVPDSVARPTVTMTS